MTAIRWQDRLFLAVVVPVALAAAYVGWWRSPAVRRLSALQSRDREVVSAEAYAQERRNRAAALEAATSELAAERAQPPPAVRVKAEAQASAAMREREVIGVFRSRGLTLVKSSVVEAAGTAAEALSATGVRPVPIARRYVLMGDYPALRAALADFSAREAAVVVERLAMSPDGRWEVTVYE